MIPGFTSTGSKRPQVMFGDDQEAPRVMTRAQGCSVWDSEGREYLDTTMALGAVSLGYGHPAVNEAAEQAVRDGVVGPLAPVLENRIAERLRTVMPWMEAALFFKTGAEAVSAAVRIARVETERDRLVTCGYQGWLDGLAEATGVPAGVRCLREEIPFNDIGALRDAINRNDPVAAIVIEPVIDAAPEPEWVDAVNAAKANSGAILVLDEIKTGLRLGVGGAGARYGFAPDLTVLGKALGNGFPIAAVGGSRDLMAAATRTWISSTLATEFVALAAAGAVLDTYERQSVAGHIAAVGNRLYQGLERIAETYPTVVTASLGVPEFCYLQTVDEATSVRMAAACAARGLLFKRNAYNFVSLAHSNADVDRVLETLGNVVDALSASE